MTDSFTDTVWNNTMRITRQGLVADAAEEATKEALAPIRELLDEAVKAEIGLGSAQWCYGRAYLAQQVLDLLDGKSPAPACTQEEKVAFRKQWDAQVDAGKAKP